MNPKTAQVAILLIEQLFEFLLELKKNGQLDEAALDAMVAGTNATNRETIKAFLADAK